MMIQHTYKIKSYLNASHAVRWAQGQGQVHNHTWEIVTEFSVVDNELVPFNVLERASQVIFDQYSGKFLNELAAFSETNPTLENFSALLWQQLDQTLTEKQALLIPLEVGESPTRFCCLTRS
ncbi:6-carboxytetrahydropterin synthase [Lapidilactobacillus luobeiensis]|uniref:6-carboxytetrahydropterin synthase n=1 Tax=Lapidilactobacillus luobeiensis TaxID=2950371 RepID=UPI0021C296E2|nr:6-carboxytetrahydropterin synthase [Lapidilactobacillus luobeiensis]